MLRMFATGVSFLLATSATAQDLEFLRALAAAQRARPAQLTSSARIAPAAEPGSALVVHGQAFAADGRTPLANAIVFAYHADRDGVYDRRGAPAHSWRLKGWAKTGADGKFEFHTIRPGAYPGGKVAAHIHLTLFIADGVGYHAGGVLFADDPLVSASEREQHQKDGAFGSIRPVRREGTVQHIDVRTRLVPSERFTAR
jgi:protocatechuate 3,4-dioxygenase beta subunit